MVAQREKFSSQASPEVLAEMRAIARREGRQLQAVLEEAMIDYIETKKSGNVRPPIYGPFSRQSRT